MSVDRYRIMPKIVPLLNIAKQENGLKIAEPVPNPSPAFRFCVIGASMSGKTNMLMNCLLEFWKVNNKTIWDEIFIFAQSAQQDDQWKLITNDPEVADKTYLSDQLSEDIIKQILSEPNDGKRRLVWIDDFAGDKSRLDSTVLHDLFFKGRQNNTSVLITSQYYYNIPIALRTNATHLAIYRLPQKNTLTMVRNELSTVDVAGDLFDEIFETAVSEPYHFLFIEMFPKRRWFGSFEYEIEIQGKPAEEKKED